MSQLIDNAIALRILSMLVKPFTETEAFKLGIIDANGKNRIPIDKLTKQDQKDAYNYLNRLVFNVKKIINRLPGGDTRLKNVTAAMFLIRESHAKHLPEVEAPLLEKVLARLQAGVTFVEDELLVTEFMQLDETSPPSNIVGAGVSTDQAIGVTGFGTNHRKKRRMAAFAVSTSVFRRFASGKPKYGKWSSHLNLQDPGERTIYNFARKNPSAVIVLQNGKERRAIRFNRKGGGSWNSIKRRRAGV